MATPYIAECTTSLPNILGGELFFWIRRLGRLKPDHARFYFAEATAAIDHLHQNGVVYRDLKPGEPSVFYRAYVSTTAFVFISSCRERRFPVVVAGS